MRPTISAPWGIFRGCLCSLTGGVFLLAPGLLSASMDRPSPASLRWNLPPAERFLSVISPPPAVDSPETRGQIRAILRRQAAADPLRLASARWTYEFSVFTFSLALGPDFIMEKYPMTGAFFFELNNLIHGINRSLKDHFKAPHPFQVDSRIRRFAKAVPGYDYPSYHAMRCAVFSRVLAELDPVRAKAFHSVAERVEVDRIFAGEHFPYSVAAGRKVGEAIFEALSANPRFTADLRRLKAAEWSPPPEARNSFSTDD